MNHQKRHIIKTEKEGQPFFAVFNLNVSHESSIHKSITNEELRHDPSKVTLPPLSSGYS